MRSISVADRAADHQADGRRRSAAASRLPRPDRQGDRHDQRRRPTSSQRTRSRVGAQEAEADARVPDHGQVEGRPAPATLARRGRCRPVEDPGLRPPGRATTTASGEDEGRPAELGDRGHASAFAVARRPRRRRRRRRAGTGRDSAGRSPPPAGCARSGRICGPRRAAARRRRRRPRPGGRRRPGPRPATSVAWLVRNTSAGVEAVEGGQQAGVGDVDHAARPPARAPMRFSRRSTSSAPVTTRVTACDLGPARGLGVVAPGGRRVGDHPQAVGAGVREARGPGLLHGEGDQRREPGGQPLEHRVHHRARGAAAQRCRAGRSRGRRGGCRRTAPTARPGRSRPAAASTSWKS